MKYFNRFVDFFESGSRIFCTYLQYFSIIH